MKRLVAVLCFFFLVLLAWQQVRRLRSWAAAERSRTNLKLIAVLLAQHASEYGRFPPAQTYDNEGVVLHSWRLGVIESHEYLDFDKHMDRSKSWATPQNRKFLSVFDDSMLRNPSAVTDAGVTPYVALVGPGTVWGSDIDLAELPDDTLLIIEWPQSDVYWGEPRDLTIDQLGTLIATDRFATSQTEVLRFVDWSGSVHELPLDISTTETVRRLSRIRRIRGGAEHRSRQ